MPRLAVELKLEAIRLHRERFCVCFCDKYRQYVSVFRCYVGRSIDIIFNWIWRIKSLEYIKYEMVPVSRQMPAEHAV